MSLSGLTITGGNASNNGVGDGGGILSYDALSISNSTLEDNQAPNGFGGAIYSASGMNASLTLTNDIFKGNSVGSAAMTTGFQLGGAIFNSDGVATISSSTFVNNQAIGSQAQGGAIQTSFGSTLIITGTTFTNNQAIGSYLAAGGAIFGDPAQVTISSSQFLNNKAEGSNASGENSGGAIAINAIDANDPSVQVTETISNSLFSGNRVVGSAGSGASVEGGAISNSSGTLDVAGSTFVGNEAVGGSSTSGSGGSATGGAINTNSSVLNLSEDLFYGNEALGGSSPMGVQSAIGGAVYAARWQSLCTKSHINHQRQPLLGKRGHRGNRRRPVGGNGRGAVGYSSTTPLNVNDTEFVGNAVTGSRGQNGGAGTEADGGAIWADGSVVTIQGGLIADNSAQGGRGGNAPGGDGGDGGIGGGGGIANLQGSAMTITGTDHRR